jgi:Tfp pilus assembly protein PilF
VTPQRDYDRAIACFRQAIALDPKYATAHYNLGVALKDKGRLDEAMAEWRQTFILDPKDARAHYNLGLALHSKGQLDEAVAEYRQAISLDTKLAQAHYGLGLALRYKGQLDEAVAEWRQAIILDPEYARAHYNLGAALHNKGQLDEAVAEYRQAIILDPKYARAHYNLGAALAVKGDLDGAVACYKKALELMPKHAEAHCNLGDTLRKQGRFAEALASLRRGHELGSKQPGWRYPSAQWVREVERMLVLEMKLPAILTGKATPTNPGEAVVLASMCQQPYKKLYATSVRLYADAFNAEPKLAADNRYDAACSAALAAAGQGEDARLLPDKSVSMFRSWALGWLHADLKAYAELTRQNKPALKQTIQQRLTHWRSDPDLASLRDPQSLNRLPDIERAAWQALWHEVDELAK